MKIMTKDQIDDWIAQNPEQAIASLIATLVWEEYAKRGGEIKMTNEEMLKALKAIDKAEEVEVNAWEADFMEGVLTQSFPLKGGQITIAEKIIDKYKFKCRGLY